MHGSAERFSWGSQVQSEASGAAKGCKQGLQLAAVRDACRCMHVLLLVRLQKCKTQAAPRETSRIVSCVEPLFSLRQLTRSDRSSSDTRQQAGGGCRQQQLTH